MVRYHSQRPLSRQEIARLREILDWFAGLPDRVDSISDSLDSVWNRIGTIEENVHGLFKTARPIHHLLPVTAITPYAVFIVTNHTQGGYIHLSEV